MYQQMVGVPVTVRIPQFQKQCSSTSKKLQRHQVAAYKDFKAQSLDFNLKLALRGLK